MSDAKLHAALRARYPLTFPPLATEQYLDGWIAAALAPGGTYEPAPEQTDIEAEWLAARRTALGLAGCWASAGRGVA